MNELSLKSEAWFAVLLLTVKRKPDETDLQFEARCLIRARRDYP